MRSLIKNSNKIRNTSSSKITRKSKNDLFFTSKLNKFGFYFWQLFVILCGSEQLLIYAENLGLDLYDPTVYFYSMIFGSNFIREYLCKSPKYLNMIYKKKYNYTLNYVFCNHIKPSKNQKFIEYILSKNSIDLVFTRTVIKIMTENDISINIHPDIISNYFKYLYLQIIKIDKNILSKINIKCCYYNYNYDSDNYRDLFQLHNIILFLLKFTSTFNENLINQIYNVQYIINAIKQTYDGSNLLQNGNLKNANINELVNYKFYQFCVSIDPIIETIDKEIKSYKDNLLKINNHDDLQKESIKNITDYLNEMNNKNYIMKSFEN